MIRRTRLSSEKYKKHMSELYELTLDRWEYESELLQVPKEMKEKILKSMKNPSWDVINQEDVRDFSITMQEIHKHDETFSIASLQNWVRDLQAVMNHTMYEKNGYITSRFAYDLFDKCSMLSGKHYVDVGILLERLLEAHKGV